MHPAAGSFHGSLFVVVVSPDLPRRSKSAEKVKTNGLRPLHPPFHSTRSTDPPGSKHATFQAAEETRSRSFEDGRRPMLGVLWIPSCTHPVVLQICDMCQTLLTTKAQNHSSGRTTGFSPREHVRHRRSASASWHSAPFHPAFVASPPHLASPESWSHPPENILNPGTGKDISMTKHTHGACMRVCVYIYSAPMIYFVMLLKSSTFSCIPAVQLLHFSYLSTFSCCFCYTGLPLCGIDCFQYFDKIKGNIN